MATIDCNQPYPKPERYWELVNKTLVDVFEVDPPIANDTVAKLAKEIVKRPSEEQLHFYHSEPLDVAADITGRHPDDSQVRAYQNLVSDFGWKS
jgi:hypothetical protein